MIIRIANINDIDKILELEDQIFELHFRARSDWIEKNPKNYEFKKGTIEGNNSKIFLAEENNEIIGFCIINIRETKNHHMYYDMINIEIENICIDEKYKQKGIGKKLFEEVKKIAKEKGAKFIELSVWEFNKNAIEFYEHLEMKTRIRKMELKVE